MINELQQEYSRGSQLNYSQVQSSLTQDFLKKYFGNLVQNEKIAEFLKSLSDRDLADASFDFKTKQHALFFAVANFASNRRVFAENIMAITLDEGLEFLNARIDFDSEPLSPLALAVKLQNVKAINFLLSLGANCQDKSVLAQLKKHLTTTQEPTDEQVKEVKKIAKIFIDSGIDLAFDGNEVVNQKFTDESQKFKKLADLNKKLSSRQIIFSENKDQDFIKELINLLKISTTDSRQTDSSHRNSIKIALVHGVKEEYGVNNLFLKKIILGAKITKLVEASCCSLFRRASRTSSLKDFLENHQDPETAKVVKDFFKMMDDQKTSQISASSSRQSSIEVRKSGSGHPRNDLSFDKPEYLRGIELESIDNPSPNTRLGGLSAPIGAVRAKARAQIAMYD